MSGRTFFHCKRSRVFIFFGVGWIFLILTAACHPFDLHSRHKIEDSKDPRTPPIINRILLQTQHFIIRGEHLESIQSVIFNTESDEVVMTIHHYSNEEIHLSPQGPLRLESGSSFELRIIFENEIATLEVPVSIDWNAIGNFRSQGILDKSTSNELYLSSNDQVAVGTEAFATGALLSVEGKVGARQFCDEDGSSCQSPLTLITSSATPWTQNDSNIYYMNGSVGVRSSNLTNVMFSIGEDRLQVIDEDENTAVKIYGPEVAALIVSDGSITSEKSFLADDALSGTSRIGTRRNNIRFESGTTAETMRLSASRLGIRDRSPDATLEVSAAGGVYDLLSISSNPETLGDILIVKNNGMVGINTEEPEAALDIKGLMRLRSYDLEPATCSIDTDGAIALNSNHKLCICRNSYGWVDSVDGVSECIW